jgi:ATP-dependent exoDNAse (exonuclease V) alpha subunit
MTINKEQGQTIPNVDIFLPDAVFSHGQLYVTLSRATTKQHVKVLAYPADHYTWGKGARVMAKGAKKEKKRTRQGKVKETIEKSNDALIQKTLSTKIKIIEHNIL